MNISPEPINFEPLCTKKGKRNLIYVISESIANFDKRALVA